MSEREGIERSLKRGLLERQIVIVKSIDTNSRQSWLRRAVKTSRLLFITVLLFDQLGRRGIKNFARGQE